MCMRLVYTDNDFYVIIYEWDFSFDRHPNGSHVRLYPLTFTSNFVMMVTLWARCLCDADIEHIAPTVHRFWNIKYLLLLWNEIITVDGQYWNYGFQKAPTTMANNVIYDWIFIWRINNTHLVIAIEAVEPTLWSKLVIASLRYIIYLSGPYISEAR